MKPVAIQVAFKHCYEAILRLLVFWQLDSRSIHMIEMNTAPHDNARSHIVLCWYLYRSLCRCFCLLFSTAGLTPSSQIRLIQETFSLFPQEVLLFNYYIYTTMSNRTGPKPGFYFYFCLQHLHSTSSFEIHSKFGSF